MGVESQSWYPEAKDIGSDVANPEVTAFLDAVMEASGQAPETEADSDAGKFSGMTFAELEVTRQELELRRSELTDPENYPEIEEIDAQLALVEEAARALVSGNN